MSVRRKNTSAHQLLEGQFACVNFLVHPQVAGNEAARMASHEGIRNFFDKAYDGERWSNV